MTDAPPPAPPEPPAQVARAPAADSPVEVLAAVRRRYPGTGIEAAATSQVPGLYRLTLSGGRVAYTDKTGRYLLLGLILDADTGSALDNQLDAVSSPIEN